MMNVRMGEERIAEQRRRVNGPVRLRQRKPISEHTVNGAIASTALAGLVTAVVLGVPANMWHLLVQIAN